MASVTAEEAYHANVRFPLEKILTISAEDWIKMQRKEGLLYQYQAVGVHVQRGCDAATGMDAKAGIRTFSEHVPRNAEVVVGYTTSVAYKERAGLLFVASGTALIPRQTKEQSNV